MDQVQETMLKHARGMQNNPHLSKYLESPRVAVQRKIREAEGSHPGQDDPSTDITQIPDPTSNVTGGEPQLTGDAKTTGGMPAEARVKEEPDDDKGDGEGVPVAKDDKDSDGTLEARISENWDTAKWIAKRHGYSPVGGSLAHSVTYSHPSGATLSLHRDGDNVIWRHKKSSRANQLSGGYTSLGSHLASVHGKLEAKDRKNCECHECGYIGEKAADGMCPNCGGKMEAENPDEEDPDKKKDEARGKNQSEVESLTTYVDSLLQGGHRYDEAECSSCKGSGKVFGKECSKCGGTGEAGDSKDEAAMDTCPECDGSGNIDGEECSKCKGEGKISAQTAKEDFDDDKLDMSLDGKTDTDAVTDLEPKTSPTGESVVLTKSTLDRLGRLYKEEITPEDLAEEIFASAF